jgi:hypothetical protein
MDILFPSESNETVTTRVEKMDSLLQDIQKVLSDIRISLERISGIEHRVDELEKTVAQLQSVSMDLRSSGIISSGNNDRITPLESMVNKLCVMTAEQKAVLNQLVETQGKSIQELRKEIHQPNSSDEPVIQEIDEIVHGR